MFNSGIYHVLRLACRWHGMLTNLAGGILRVPHSSRACVRAWYVSVCVACMFIPNVGWYMHSASFSGISLSLMSSSWLPCSGFSMSISVSTQGLWADPILV